MILDVDFLIDFFKKHTNEDSKGEMGEQDAPAAPSTEPVVEKKTKLVKKKKSTESAEPLAEEV